MQEISAIKEISKQLNKEILKELFEEYENNQTPEAQFVRDLDKIDMIMQCRCFIEKDQLSDKAWIEFISYSSKKIQTKIGQSLLIQVLNDFQKK